MGEAAAPHVLLICYPGQGHINPMLRLAKRIAAKGLLVTCSSTSIVRDKLDAASGVPAGGDGVPVGRGRIRFDFLDNHFDGAELDELLRHLETTGPLALAELLSRQAGAGRAVACVIGNPFLPWAIDVAAAAGIPSAVLWVQSCAVFSLYYHFVHGLVEFQREDDLDARFTPPSRASSRTAGGTPHALDGRCRRARGGLPAVGPGDHCTDAEFLVDELGMGVHLHAPLRREAVREAVDAATTGLEADAMLDSAKSWSAAARAAVAPGGTSDRHVQAFVDEVSRRACREQADAAKV